MSRNNTGAFSNTWDYRNQLASTTISGANTLYAYDQSGNRVMYSSPSGTTYYPNQYYNVEGAAKIKSF